MIAATPDNWFYHYQSLIGGIIALIVGVVVYFITRRGVIAHIRRFEAHDRSVALTLYVQLEFLDSQLGDIHDLFEYYLSSLRDNKDAPLTVSHSRIRPLTPPLLMLQPAHERVGLSHKVLMLLEDLKEHLQNINESVDEFDKIVAMYPRDRRGPQQLTLTEVLRQVDREELRELSTRIVDWGEKSMGKIADLIREIKTTEPNQ